MVVKVTRMTAGSTDVELWGGKEGLPSVEVEDAKFYFIKAAVDPKREVDIMETDTKQGMVTELLYIIDDSPPPKLEEITVRRRRQMVEVEDPPPELTKESTITYVRKRPLRFDDNISSTLARRRPTAGTYSRWQPSITASSDLSSNSKWFAKEKSPEAKDTKKPESTDVSSYYVRKRLSPSAPETPGFLRKHSATPSISSDSPYGERLSRNSTRPAWSRSRPTTDDSTSSTSSRYGRDTATTTSSRFGSDSSALRDTSVSTTSGTTGSSLYRRDSTKTPTTTTLGSSLGRSDSLTTRLGREREVSATRISSRYGRDSSSSRLYGSSYGSSSYGSSSSGSSSYGSRFLSSRYR